MPYSIRKLPNQDLYRVYNTQTKAIHSYSTTLENAKKQVKLLHMVDAGVPLEKKGGGMTDIDKTSTGVMRIKLNDAAKKFLNDKLIPLITNTTIRITDSRQNSGVGRSQVFGVGNIRGKGFGEFKNNTRHPDLYRALLIFGMKIVPDYIPFTAIQVNHNYKTKKHIDGNNIGLSLAVSFGDFTGGELVIGKSDYQTKEHPVIFNGALTEHFNRPIKGDRYSLVFFINAPKKYSDAEVYNLHNKIVSKIKLMKGEGIIGGSIETDKFDRDGIVSLPQFRSITINLPTYMYKRLPDIKGKPPPYRYRLVVPITSSRILSSRKNAVSLNINQKPISKSKITIFRVEDEEPKLSDFSPADQLKIEAYYDKVKANETKTLDRIGNDEYEIKQRGKPLPCSNAVAKVVAKPVPKQKEQKKKMILRIEGDEDDDELPDLEPDDKKSKVKDMVLQIEEKQQRIIERKRIEDEREQEKAEFTPEKVLELVNGEKANNSWVNIQKNPFISVRWLVNTDKDPYGGRLSNVENMEYFIKEPKRVYKVWGSEELIDPLTLKVLGEFTEPTKMLSNTFNFKLTDIGRQRLEEYKAIAKADEKNKLKKLKNVIDTMKAEEKPDIAKYKKLSGEYNDMVKAYKTKFSKEGKGLSAGDLRELLNATYDGKEKVAGYEIDKSLSTKTSKVYRNPETNQVVVGHMGTEGLMDWGNNAVFALGGKSAYKKTARYKEAEKVQRNAEKKYGAENVSTIGHSQGGLQAELLGGKSKETITLNKATMIGQNKRNKNQTDIHTSGDIVSSLNPFQKRGKDDIVIKGKSYNPLNIHSAKSLRGLDENQIIGNGLENNISSNSIKMPNKWIEYVKEYASKNGMSYRDALKDPKCKAGYQR
jgi:hypothetical protein